jgi:hypothetical protein
MILFILSHKPYLLSIVAYRRAIFNRSFAVPAAAFLKEKAKAAEIRGLRLQPGVRLAAAARNGLALQRQELQPLFAPCMLKPCDIYF